MKKTALLAGGAAAALTSAALVREVYRYTFHKDSSALLDRFLELKKHDEDYYLHRDSDADYLRAQPCRRMEISSVRGHKLQGFYYMAGDKPSGRIVFMIHGYRSEHAETVGMYYRYYMSRGIDIFTCDHEAAGESEGTIIGYDYYESRDCLRWIDRLIEVFGSDIRILLHGFSMGGGTVLVMSDQCPSQVRAIVDDCGYTCAEELVAPKLGGLYPLINGLNRRLGGYDLKDTDARPHLKNATLPILFVHGEEDPTVPFAMGQELYGLYEGEKDCLFVPGTRHVECMHTAPEAYEEKLDKWLRYLN